MFNLSSIFQGAKIPSFVILLLLANFNVALATNYYLDYSNGLDSNNGLTTNTPWKNLSKANTFSFLPGDSVLFKRGSIWRGQLLPHSGSHLGHVVYGAYGSGNKPLLLGSVNKSSISDWTNIGGNIWQSVQASSVDIGNLIFNHEAIVGVKKWQASDLQKQGDFWWDKSNTTKVQLYSVSNPATYYSNIEIAIGNFIIYAQLDSFIVFQDLELKYGSVDGIEIRNSHHIIIQDCDLSYIGGSELTNQVRWGGGIQFWAYNFDHLVQRCTFHEIYDDAVTNQSNNSVVGSVQQYNIRYINNLIWNCSESSFCIFLRPSSLTGSVLKNIYFENNTCVNAGGGWGGLQRPDKKGFQVYFSSTTAPTDSIFIRNNIFYGSRSVIFIDNSGIQPFPFVTMDYNNWYTQNNTDTIAAFWTPSSLNFYTKTQFTNYQTDHQKDPHSFMGDPLLVNPATNDYRLTSSSPCVNTGINNGIATDFSLTARPQGSNYDIGAYEFVSATSLEEKKDGKNGFKIYPNANHGIFTIATNSNVESTIKIYDLNGKLTFDRQIVGTEEIDASILHTGIYNISISNNESFGSPQKLIIFK